MGELQAVELRRGLDSAFFGEEHGSWTAVQVLAPCAEVAATLAKTSAMRKLLGDAFDPMLRIPAKDSWKAVFVYQLKGHAWTLIQANANLVYFDTARLPSKKLTTKVMVYSYEDIAGVGGYMLYDQGREEEYYSTGSTPSFEDSNREQNLAAGWILSSDNLRQLRSKRLRDIDLDSPEAAELPNRTAIDLDLYVPCDIWDVDETGQIRLATTWSAYEILSAQVLMAKG